MLRRQRDVLWYYIPPVVLYKLVSTPGWLVRDHVGFKRLYNNDELLPYVVHLFYDKGGGDPRNELCFLGAFIKHTAEEESR